VIAVEIVRDELQAALTKAPIPTQRKTGPRVRLDILNLHSMCEKERAITTKRGLCLRDHRFEPRGQRSAKIVLQ
jgi:hypothetical protein